MLILGIGAGIFFACRNQRKAEPPLELPTLSDVQLASNPVCLYPAKFQPDSVNIYSMPNGLGETRHAVMDLNCKTDGSSTGNVELPSVSKN